MAPHHGVPLGDVSVREFLRRHWQQEPLFVRGALPAFRCPVSKAELFALAARSDVESRLVLGRSRPAFRLEQGPFPSSTWRKLPKTHWTLLVQDVDKHLPHVAELIEPFTFIPRWRIDDIMISYAPPGGTVGPHYDNYDVFLLQGLGKRRWEIGPRPERPQWLAGTELQVLRHFVPHERLLSQAGDLLYLPPSIAHHGVAESECITLSIGFRAPSERELAFAFSEELLASANDSHRYGDPGLHLATHSGAIERTAVRQVERMLQHALKPAPGQITSWFGRFVTECKPQLARERKGVAVGVQELKRAAREGRGVERALGTRWAFHPAARQLHLFADGVEWKLPKRLLPLVAALCDAPVLQLAEHREWLAERTGNQLLRELFERGLLCWQQPAPRRKRRRE